MQHYQLQIKFFFRIHQYLIHNQPFFPLIIYHQRIIILQGGLEASSQPPAGFNVFLGNNSVRTPRSSTESSFWRTETTIVTSCRNSNNRRNGSKGDSSQSGINSLGKHGIIHYSQETRAISLDNSGCSRARFCQTHGKDENNTLKTPKTRHLRAQNTQLSFIQAARSRIPDSRRMSP